MADCGENMGTHRSRLGVIFCVKESRLEKKLKERHNYGKKMIMVMVKEE